MRLFSACAFALVTLLVTSMGQESVKLPCDITRFAVAADGSGLWAACSQNSAAHKGQLIEGSTTPPRHSPDDDPFEIYWIDAKSKQLSKVAGAKAQVEIVAAPIGSKALLVTPEEKSSGSTVLLDKQTVIKQLDVDAYFLLWSANSRVVYSYGGSTIQADAWNILQINDLASGSKKKAKLRAATEDLRVCKATGMVYSVTPKYPGFAGETIEYTPQIQYLRKVHGWIGGEFSAKCGYVASEQSWHGPLPWKIYDTKTGKELYSFAAVDNEGVNDLYLLTDWNPKFDAILLRQHLRKDRQNWEVFDVKAGRVLQTLPHTDDLVAWWADGAVLVMVKHNTVSWIPVRLK